MYVNDVRGGSTTVAASAVGMASRLYDVRGRSPAAAASAAGMASRLYDERGGSPAAAACAVGVASRLASSCCSHSCVLLSSLRQLLKVLSFSWSGRHWRSASRALHRKIIITSSQQLKYQLKDLKQKTPPKNTNYSCKNCKNAAHL